jgi:RNA polymerase sigma-70 factor, ECF subfamily
MEAMDTAQMIARCRAGDAGAIELLLQTQQPRLFKLALAVLDDPAEADEAVQDALIAALQRMESFHGDASLATWLYSITLNACRSRLRKRQVRLKLGQTLQGLLRLVGGKGIHPEEMVVAREAEDRVWLAVQALDEKHRLPLVMRYYDDLSIAEIGALLRISEGTVCSRLFTARERLREQLVGCLD